MAREAAIASNNNVDIIIQIITLPETNIAPKNS